MFSLVFAVVSLIFIAIPLFSLPFHRFLSPPHWSCIWHLSGLPKFPILSGLPKHIIFFLNRLLTFSNSGGSGSESRWPDFNACRCSLSFHRSLLSFHWFHCHNLSQLRLLENSCVPGTRFETKVSDGSKIQGLLLHYWCQTWAALEHKCIRSIVKLKALTLFTFFC